MDRLKAATVVQAAVFLFALTVSAGAQATQGKTLVPGDTNCDDRVDISDVVFLVASLYLGAGPPCPLADRPELLAQVDDLRGQVALLHADLAAKVVELAQAADLLVTREAELKAQCDAQVVALQAQLDARGASLQAVGDQLATCEAELKDWKENHWEECRNRWDRFVSNGDGTISDICTELIWQSGIADLNGDGMIQAHPGQVVPADLTGWQGAMAYAEALSLGGHEDWRLPEVEEIFTLAQNGLERPELRALCLPPAMYDGLSETNNPFFWTATPYGTLPQNGIFYVFAGYCSLINFNNAFSYSAMSATRIDRGQGCLVLAVRGPRRTAP